MEIKYFAHFFTLSWSCICLVLCHEFNSLGKGQFCRDAVCYITRSACHVVWSFVTADFCGSLFWIQKNRNFSSCEDKSNSQTNSRTINLHATNSWHNYGWSFTIWLYFHPAFFYSKQYLGQSSVLYVRISVSCFRYFGNYLLGDDDSSLLFSPMCRGLSLVVAFVFDEWIHCILFVHLLHSLLCDQVKYRRYRFNFPVFWIHSHHGVSVLFAYRYDWIFRLLLVRS